MSFRDQTYKETQERNHHQGQDSGFICGGRKEIVIGKGQLEGNVLFFDLSGTLQVFIS